MRLFLRLAGVGLMLTPLAGCRRAPMGDEWANLVTPSVLAKASLKYYWRSKVDLQEDETIGQIWRLDEKFYALSSHGRLVALDAATGVYKWDLEIAGPAEMVFSPFHVENVLLRRSGPQAAEPFDAMIINTVTHALVIDRQKGRLVRKIELPSAANTPCSSDGIHLYVGSVGGWYYSIILDTGLIRWQLATEDLITARPVYVRGQLYVASQDTKFYAINPEAEENRHLWTQTTDGPLTAEFVVDPRGCFVPSQDYKLYVYDGMTGEELWAFRTQGPLMRAVQVGQRTVYQFAEKDRLYALDLASGRERWKSFEAREVLATVEPRALDGVANEDQPYVFLLTADRHLLMISETLGEAEVKLPLTGLDLFVTNATGRVIYAGTSDGKFVCFSPKSLRHLRAEMLKD